jgi:bifunctional N-acetylglucosamine-1-phosphate-uridyltransferase/glucosamine-1-phosphate-acetyltransferase GlmU-like protein
MVVAIILIVTIGKVISNRQKAKYGIIEDEDMMTQRRIGNAETGAMQSEIRELKERIQVLERIATENSSATDVSRQIEALRDR